MSSDSKEAAGGSGEIGNGGWSSCRGVSGATPDCVVGTQNDAACGTASVRLPGLVAVEAPSASIAANRAGFTDVHGVEFEVMTVARSGPTVLGEDGPLLQRLGLCGADVEFSASGIVL